MDFLEITECLQDQQIDTALDERLNLLTEGLARFLERGFAQRFNPGSQRANRSGHPHIEALGGFSSQTCPGAVDVPDFVSEAVPGQAKRICTKRVGFNNFGASL